MVSDREPECMYLTQVTYAGGVREHVADTECDGFDEAHELAKQLKCWLTDGTARGLPGGALDLRGELERAGLDPADAEVAVVRLDPRGPGRWDCDGEVLCVVDVWAAHADPDDDAGGSDVDTVTLPVVPVITQAKGQ